MIRKNICFIIMSTIIMSSYAGAPSDTTKADFLTSGNCYLCKQRIEKSVKDCTGVFNVFWDHFEKVKTSISYDKSLTDLSSIMQIITDVGHDTEWFETSDSSYKTLEKYKCCSYDRTIDYSNIQIGYLSLMGAWEATLGVEETINNDNFSVFYSSADGLLHIDAKNEFNKGFELNVYSISGRNVCTERIHDNNNSVDISNLSKGSYLIVLSDGKKNLYKNKIIKI